jgi:ankyrin repeat protein
MRLLECDSDNGKFKLTEDLVRDIPSYAILSHTWGPDAEEVTFGDIVSGTGEGKTGYEKISFCATQAKRDGLRYFWVDTCCIDKSNSTELSKAINSMFQWYHNAARCYVYLWDVSGSDCNGAGERSELAWLPAFRASRWFTRGWTLQELLAPKLVQFFTRDGRQLGDKRSLRQEIREITGIAIAALEGSVALAQFDEEERFRWAETRRTTQEEDWAYCLLGIFGVFMPLIYGEGKAHAVRRLKKEIADAVNRDDGPKRQEWNLSEKEEKCHQLFRLTSGDQDATYEWYKDRVEARVEGTCQWFLTHNNFKNWLEQESGPLLVSADPGCGKSVLAKYLIDHGLPRSATICYFFFKDQDQNTVRQALCALLHQIFFEKPFLIKLAMPEYSSDGMGLVNATASLWRIFDRVLRDPRAGAVIIVLDALDECAEPEFKDLIQNVKRQFYSSNLGDCKLKFLLTSRPYNQIVSEFQDLLGTFPRVQIPGEEESESISQEVNLVIKYRANRLAKEKRLPDGVRDHLTKKLLEISHRTYLWVYLVFDYLKREVFRKTAGGVESAITTLPETVNDAYEEILNKCHNHQLTRKALAIILAARRPLTLSEMNIAMNVQDNHRSFYDLDLEEDDDFKSTLRSWCGLFISVHHGKVYFLHQTAREFLLADLSSTTVQLETRWHQSIGTHNAHAVLAEQCVFYLNLFNFAKSGHDSGNNNTTLLDYSAKNWADHFHEAKFADGAAIIFSALRISNPDSIGYSAWSGIYWKNMIGGIPKNWTSLFVASYFGHEAVVKLLLVKGKAEPNSKDNYEQTPLSLAAERGHEAVVELLLAIGKAEPDSKDKYGRTPLSLAAEKGHEAIFKLLLATGKAELNSKDTGHGRTPLSLAAEKGHEAILKLLLATGKAELNSKDTGHGRTPLLYAAKEGHQTVVKLLLSTGKVELNLKDRYGRTPLSHAATRGHETIVKLLLATGKAELNSKDTEYGRTPLLYAAKEGHQAVIKLLLSTGKVELDLKDRSGRTPLSYAAARGNETIVKLLLATGKVEPNLKDELGWTPLLYAALNGNKVVAKLLLATGKVKPDLKDKLGGTPLLYAAGNGNEAFVKLLLATGKVKANLKDELGRTPLSYAAENGHEAIVKLLEA